jgi:hypothetical protein
MSQTIPLSRRRGDILIVAFFLLNLLFITYIVDLEQLVIPDAAKFTYPAWPPPFMVDIIHSYGRTFDPLLIARPAWWKMTILIDVLFFGPFYGVGLYTFIKGKEWIRLPSILYSAVLITNVAIILGEEFYGSTPAPQPLVVLLLNAPWFLMPLFIIYRMGRSLHPFTEPATVPAVSIADTSWQGAATADLTPSE